MLLPLHPMLTNLPPNSFNFNPPKANKILSINANMVLDVAKTPIVSTHEKMGSLSKLTPHTNGFTTTMCF